MHLVLRFCWFLRSSALPSKGVTLPWKTSSLSNPYSWRRMSLNLAYLFLSFSISFGIPYLEALQGSDNVQRAPWSRSQPSNPSSQRSFTDREASYSHSLLANYSNPRCHAPLLVWVSELRRLSATCGQSGMMVRGRRRWHWRMVGTGSRGTVLLANSRPYTTCRPMPLFL
jgi:hypothetical protein